MVSNLISAFMLRKPWAAAIVALVIDPVWATLYLGKGRIAILYVVLQMFLYALVYMPLRDVIAMDLKLFVSVCLLVIRIVGAVHSYVIAKKHGPQRPTVWFARWYWIATVLFIVPMTVAILVRTLVWEPFNIPAQSMLPNLQVGDHLAVSKYAYGYSRYSLPYGPPLFTGRIFERVPERGDIAVFKLPSNPRIDDIKRLVGLPGDRIQMISGILHINGSSVDRKQDGFYDVGPPYADYATRYPLYVETLPNGRSYRTLDTEATVALDNTPIYVVPEGHFFALGDNRDRSADSRVLSQVGYIPFDNLVGPLAFIYWNSLDGQLKILD